jgi:HlyD family secretion protein
VAKRSSRKMLTLVATGLVAGALILAFQPAAVLVDLGALRQGAMTVTIDEEGRTRVHDAYTVSTPVAGRLLRIDVEPGDPVVAGETIVARMLPTNPAVLDARTREQARATAAAARAALRLAEADLLRAQAERELVVSDLQRTNALAARGTVSRAALERAEQKARASSAALDTAEAAVAMRQAELVNAEAQMIGFDDPGLVSGIINGTSRGDEIILRAPASGYILRVLERSETTLPVGAPVIEIGDIENDLEVEVKLLSRDAVRVQVGNRVIIDSWGGEYELLGRVSRVDPWGYSQVSALGVEEQRVNTVIRFTGDSAERQSLGHGFRVRTRIVIWDTDDALIVPSNALFRDGSGWAVFVLADDRAVLTPVRIGQNNGQDAEVLHGLSLQDQVVLYPASGLADGDLIALRQY